MARFPGGEPVPTSPESALVPPLGLLLNGQPFAAIFNMMLIVFCLILGWILPAAHAIIAVHMKRDDRKHREIVDATLWSAAGVEVVNLFRPCGHHLLPSS